VLWVVVGAWVVALVVAIGHAWLTRSAPAPSSRTNGAPAASTRTSGARAPEPAALAEARQAAELADPWRGGRPLSDELEVVLRTAAYRDRGRDAAVSSRDFVAAALCNRELCALLERAGHDPDALRVALAALPSDVHDSAAQGTAVEAPDYAVSAALSSALSSAVLRELVRHAPITLGQALASLAREQSPVARWLSSLGVRFSSLPEALAAASDAGPFLLNDRATPMRAVVTLLTTVFGLSPLTAAYVMSSVHVRGFAALGPHPPERRTELVTAATAFCADHGLGLVIAPTQPETREWRRDPAAGRLPPDLDPGKGT
jgi:ATP-dependent Clp protease adapter protein ClpS